MLLCWEVYLRKGVHAFEREQEPAPQLNNTMTAAEIEESLQSPACCIWRSWSCLARMHILCVAQLGAVLQKDSKTASYSIACKEGLCVRNQDQELLRGFLISSRAADSHGNRDFFFFLYIYWICQVQSPFRVKWVVQQLDGLRNRTAFLVSMSTVLNC